MPINSYHPQYSLGISERQRCRDVLSGSDAVKAAGEKYLPQLTGQTSDEYKAYKTRALFFNITGRIVSGLVGAVMAKRPKIQADSMESYFSIDPPMNKTFYEIFKTLVQETLIVGRAGMLVDMPISGGSPYVTLYEDEAIINWFVDATTDKLTEVILRETVLEPKSAEDRYELTPKVRYRRLYLNADSVYTVEVYDDDKFDTAVTTAVPTVLGKPLDFIPFVCINTFGLSLDRVKPPILDIVDINLSHYRTSADLEHGRHYTALPTPVVTGGKSDAKLHLGSQTAWIISNDKAKAFYLEYTGQGLTSLETAMKEKQAQMSQFSARLMDTSTRGSEAVDTVRMRHSAESTTLTDIAMAVELGLNRVYNYIATILKVTTPVITLDKDFLRTKLTAAELKELLKGYVDGSIDKSVLLYNLERGELVPEQTFSGGK